MKAVVVENFTIGVGDQATNKEEASDGTQYTFVGEQEENGLELPILCVDDSLGDLLTTIYGAGSAVASGTVWDLKNAGSTAQTISLTVPTTGNSKDLVWTAVNAKGVSLIPTFDMELGGYTSTVKFIADYWQAKITT